MPMNCLIHEDEQRALCLMSIAAAMLSILVCHEHCRGLGGIQPLILPVKRQKTCRRLPMAKPPPPGHMVLGPLRIAAKPIFKHAVSRSLIANKTKLKERKDNFYAR